MKEQMRRRIVYLYLTTVLLTGLATAACGPQVNSILSIMKSRAFTRFCTQMLPITTSTSVVKTQYTSTVTYSLSTVFATTNITATSTNWIFDIAGTSTVVVTAADASATGERLPRRASSSPVSTPPVLKSYPPASLTAACSCWSLPTPVRTSTTYLPATTVTRNATTTYTLSRSVVVTTASLSSRFVATTTKTVTPSVVPSAVGACKPYSIRGTRVFSSAANETLFEPESFVAYALLNGDDAVLGSVAVNSTDANNKTVTLIYDYSTYRANAATTIIAPDGTNIVLYTNGSVGAFAGSGCSKPVRWDPDSQQHRRELEPVLVARATSSLKSVLVPAYDVSIAISDRCFQPVAGDSSWRIFCGVDYISSLGIQPWIEVLPQPDATNKAVVRGRCPARNVTDQSQTPACTKTAQQLRDVCDVYSQAGQAMGPVDIKNTACTSLANSVTGSAGPQAGGIVASICAAVFVGTNLFCAGLKFKQDHYCTALPTSLGLTTRAYGLFGTVPETRVYWTQGDPAPSALALQGTIDVPWDSKCRNTYSCDCHCNDQKFVYSPWTQTYAGINVPVQVLSPYYRQYVERVTNSSIAAGVAECKRLADQPQFTSVYSNLYSQVIWYSYENWNGANGAGYWGSTCQLPKLDSLGPEDMTFNRDVEYYSSSEYTGSSAQVVFVRDKRKVCVAADQCRQVICA